MLKRNSLILEACWEACNKVGGIYTVLTSKAEHVVEKFKDNYIVIGPYFRDKAKGEFQESAPPDFLKNIFKKLNEEGIICHWGKWLIGGEPKVILVDFTQYRFFTNDIKTKLWNDYQIDSLYAPTDFNDPIVWSWAVGRLAQAIQTKEPKRDIILHAHEWLSASAILYLKTHQSQVRTIFTTHATVLGRALASIGFPLYEDIDEVDVQQKSYELGIAAKHQVEQRAAQEVDRLTTVSEITALEVEKFLMRKADALLPNGLNLKANLTFEDISLSHRLQRDRMREFLLHYFFPYYSFDLRKSLFYFISGRYEFHNKGIDLFIDALGELNSRLKKDKKESKTIIVFILVPLPLRGIKPQVRGAKEIFEDVVQTLDESRVTTESNLLYNIMAEKPISAEALFEKNTLKELRRKLLKLKHSEGLPPICAHDLIEQEQNNAIIRRLKERNLLNQEDNKVKIIVYPDYLTGSDGLLNLSYQECVQGSHLGVFPSYYEPWGYTPLEAAGLGVATITTDLAGFGRFIKNYTKDKKDPGIFVLNRFKKEYDKIVNSLADLMYQYAHFTYEQRVQNKINASNLARYASWNELIKHYFKIYEN